MSSVTAGRGCSATPATPGELPSQSDAVPRFIEETVMRQLESDQALARIGDETTITAVIVLIETGLRSQDALQLAG